MPNRNPVKQFFITFPKSNVDKVTFRDTILRFGPDYYKVVEEKHKDGTPHLHCVLRTKNSYTKKFILTYLKEKFPDDYKRIDVEPVRSIKHALNYLSKEDTSPLVSGEYEERRNPKKSWQTTFARELGYKSVEDLIDTYKKDSEELQLLRKEIMELKVWYFQNYNDVSIPNEILCAEERLFSTNAKVKDDMTKLKNFYKISL